MYLILKEEKLKEITLRALKKAGAYRRLAREVKIPVSTICDYISRSRTIKDENLSKLTKYLGIEISEADIIKELPNNWKQIIGGQNCVRKKKLAGTLNKQLEDCRKGLIYNGCSLKDWHKRMKEENLEAYHIIQYNHFKKVAEYKFATNNGEKVRNKLEKDVADLLQSLKISYQYEPLVKAGKRYFFPDFVIDDKIIIECTMWRGYDKAVKLKEKIKYLEKKYKVYVVIPPKLEKYYQSIKPHLITNTSNLKLFSNI